MLNHMLQDFHALFLHYSTAYNGEKLRIIENGEYL